MAGSVVKLHRKAALKPPIRVLLKLLKFFFCVFFDNASVFRNSLISMGNSNSSGFILYHHAFKRVKQPLLTHFLASG